MLDRAARDLPFARALRPRRRGGPRLGRYQAQTERTIPVVALRENARPGPPVVDASSPGEAIKVVHDVFRRELDLIRAKFAALGGGTTLGAQLRVNCLTLCAGPGNHHAGEDTALFPFLADRHPHPAPVLDRLRREHERITALLDGLRRVVSRQDADPVHVLPEVERPTAGLEAHPSCEEEQLVPLLE
ncbi:hemerythrin domain-containing protein [Streptomyces caeni]|uniref:Hemerythrin domain-containing protein n=1 Tax=Streptomyces caeni TaxID=2307231 RepID=A0ABW4IVK3_9ACTN